MSCELNAPGDLLQKRTLLLFGAATFCLILADCSDRAALGIFTDVDGSTVISQLNHPDFFIKLSEMSQRAAVQSACRE